MNYFLSSMVSQAPAILAYLLAIIVAVWMLGTYPRPAALVVGGFGLLLALSICMPLVQSVLIQKQVANGANMTTLFTVIGILSSIVRALAYVALLLAAFVDRTPRVSPVNVPR